MYNIKFTLFYYSNEYQLISTTKNNILGIFEISSYKKTKFLSRTKLYSDYCSVYCLEDKQKTNLKHFVSTCKWCTGNLYVWFLKELSTQDVNFIGKKMFTIGTTLGLKTARMSIESYHNKLSGELGRLLIWKSLSIQQFQLKCLIFNKSKICEHKSYRYELNLNLVYIILFPCLTFFLNHNLKKIFELTLTPSTTKAVGGF